MCKREISITDIFDIFRLLVSGYNGGCETPDVFACIRDLSDIQEENMSVTGKRIAAGEAWHRNYDEAGKDIAFAAPAVFLRYDLRELSQKSERWDITVYFLDVVDGKPENCGCEDRTEMEVLDGVRLLMKRVMDNFLGYGVIQKQSQTKIVNLSLFHAGHLPETKADGWNVSSPTLFSLNAFPTASIQPVRATYHGLVGYSASLGFQLMRECDIPYLPEYCEG